MTTDTTYRNAGKLRLQFFDYLFGGETGWLCLAVGTPSRGYFKQQWFKWPIDRTTIGSFIETSLDKYNIWYGISLFSRPERKRDYAIPGSIVWADLDEVDPFTLELAPSAIIESSPGRYQGIWSFSNVMPPDVAQDFSRRLAYAIGADKSGWDLEQLLRVPYTYNRKYMEPSEVKLLRILTPYDSYAAFEELPWISDNPANGDLRFDEPSEVPTDLPTLEQISEKYQWVLNDPRTHNGNIFRDLVTIEPNEDWSARLWRLINLCLELGMDEVDTFAVALQSKCNKYERDNRPKSHLWREVLKASLKQKSFYAHSGVGYLKFPELIDPDTVTEDSFVSEYKEWANESTDAPEQYHELSCFIALSAVISQGLALSLPYTDNFRPNLWGLLLGESTLSRKTTSMRMAMDLITDLDQSLIIASDGSAEGLLTALSNRPKQVSIYYKDEVSGFFDSINRKDYLAGIPETLTLLHDVPKVLPRVLRKETITVIEPYFIFFGGGIRDKVYSLINDDYFLSGFLPRFIVVASESDIGRIRRTGPPTSVSTSKKDALINRLADLKERYSIKIPIKIGSQTDYLEGRIDAFLTPDAWDFFGDKEEELQKTAYESYWKDLALPVFNRLAFSMLKMSMLIAASRRPPTDANKLQIELSDLHQAAFYIQKWSKYSIDLVMASGKSESEKMIERAYSFIKDSSEGTMQSDLMRRFHLNSKSMKEVRDTLFDRGLITIDKRGRGLVLKVYEA